MSNSCPVCDFISTKKYFHACLRAVCLETYCSHVPVLASQECQGFSPHLRPRLVVLNVAGTPWQVTSSFMPITPQWFHCGEGQEGPSLLPRGTDTKEVMPLSSDTCPIPEISGHLECPVPWFAVDSGLDQEWGHQSTTRLLSSCTWFQKASQKCPGHTMRTLKLRTQGRNKSI